MHVIASHTANVSSKEERKLLGDSTAHLQFPAFSRKQYNATAVVNVNFSQYAACQKVLNAQRHCMTDLSAAVPLADERLSRHAEFHP